MSFTTLIKFAPIYTLERHNDRTWNREGRALYASNALRFKPGVSDVPLLVDHHDDHRVGTVNAIFPMHWADGPWWAAIATLDDEPPTWMRRYDTRCSFRLATYSRGSFTDAELVTGALVSEVSILSPGTQPAEPLAQVLTLHREKPRPATRMRTRTTAAPTIDPQLRKAQEDAARHGILYRPAVGQVLGVR